MPRIFIEFAKVKAGIATEEAPFAAGCMHDVPILEQMDVFSSQNFSTSEKMET
jgi:hypothetical protein